MKYKAEVENEKIKRYRGNYYVVDHYGNRRVVSKAWILENKHLISNISVSGKLVYLVRDKFDMAICIIIKDMIKQMANKGGLNLKEELSLVSVDIIQTRTISTKATAREAWWYIKAFGLDNKQIFMSCLNQAQKIVHDQGKRIWQLTTSDSKIIFTNQVKAELEARRLGGAVTELN